MCVLRNSSSTNVYPQASVPTLVGLLGCYMAGLRYTLELQALQRGAAEPNQPDEDDTNQSVSSIEDDFVTALEHLEEDDTADNTCRFSSQCLLAFSGLWFLSHVQKRISFYFNALIMLCGIPLVISCII